MRRSIDEPIEREVKAPVDINQRLIEVRQELESAEAEQARAEERLRHALIVLDYWERKAAIEHQNFEIALDHHVFLVIAGLALEGIKKTKSS